MDSICLDTSAAFSISLNMAFTYGLCCARCCACCALSECTVSVHLARSMDMLLFATGALPGVPLGLATVAVAGPCVVLVHVHLGQLAIVRNCTVYPSPLHLASVVLSSSHSLLELSHIILLDLPLVYQNGQIHLSPWVNQATFLPTLLGNAWYRSAISYAGLASTPWLDTHLKPVGACLRSLQDSTRELCLSTGLPAVVMLHILLHLAASVKDQSCFHPVGILA